MFTQRPENPVLRSSKGKRQRVVEKLIAEALEPTPAYNEFESFVTIPSSRLNCTLELFWDRIRLTNTNQLPDLLTNGVGSYLASVTNVAALTARTDPVSRGNDSSLYISMQTGLLHTILNSTQLPFAYELTTGVRKVQVSWTLQAPTVNGNPIYLSWALRAVFEPNTPIDDTELDLLFNECVIA